MKKTSFYGRGWLVLVLALVVSSLGSDSLAAEKVLKMGTTIPLSGPAAEWGLAFTRMSEFFAEDANARGGLKIGGDTYKIQFFSYDNKAQPSQAAADANRLVKEDKIQYLIGGVIAATGLAVLPITEPAKVISVTGYWGKAILGPDKPYSYRQVLTGFEIAPALYKWIAKHNPRIKTLAHINPNDVSGKETASAITEAAKANGLRIVSEELFDRGTKDMTPILARLLKKNPDLIDFGVSSPGDGAVIIKRLYELGFRGAKAWTCGSSPARILETCGPDAVEGVWFTYFLDPDGPNSTPETKALSKRYREKFGEELTTPAAITSYAVLEILAKAMVRAGSTDTNRVSETVDETPMFSTSFGPMSLTGKRRYGINHQFVHRLMLSQTTAGKVVEVAWLPVTGLGTLWRKR